MELITIELHGHEMDDGRTYIDSPDLKGFHYILEADEGIEAIEPEFTVFLKAYLKAEVRKLTPARTPKAYLQRQMPPATRPAKHIPYVAELAAA